jgi:hypothetical protein
VLGQGAVAERIRQASAIIIADQGRRHTAIIPTTAAVAAFYGRDTRHGPSWQLAFASKKVRNRSTASF